VTLTHFPRDELALMSTFYVQREVMSDWSLDETNAWAHLAVFAGCWAKSLATKIWHSCASSIT
jgi:hypothetical protein